MRALAPAWPPNDAAIEHDDAQAFGGRVDRGGEPGRARRRRRRRRTARRARCVSTMPRQRASASSVGLRSTEPSGQTTSTSSAAAPYCSSSAARVGVVGRRRARGADSRCGAGSSAGAATSGDCGWPISTGPLAPDSISADAAQDQRAHDALAEVGLGDDQRAQLRRRRSAAPRRRPRRRRRRAPGGPTAGRPRRGTGPGPGARSARRGRGRRAG